LRLKCLSFLLTRCRANALRSHVERGAG
jgi:hypothetical protein